mmetsp:Transcript_75598/g.196691  ORF Transcript_75598/g.196691 Transcript_75598/m.196691 type:complete len:348 (+) Transcript_75598:186-1229(+)
MVNPLPIRTPPAKSCGRAYSPTSSSTAARTSGLYFSSEQSMALNPMSASDSNLTARADRLPFGARRVPSMKSTTGKSPRRVRTRSIIGTVRAPPVPGVMRIIPRDVSLGITFRFTVKRRGEPDSAWAARARFTAALTASLSSVASPFTSTMTSPTRQPAAKAPSCLKLLTVRRPDWMETPMRPSSGAFISTVTCSACGDEVVEVPAASLRAPAAPAVAAATPAAAAASASGEEKAVEGCEDWQDRGEVEGVPRQHPSNVEVPRAVAAWPSIRDGTVTAKEKPLWTPRAPPPATAAERGPRRAAAVATRRHFFRCRAGGTGARQPMQGRPSMAWSNGWGATRSSRSQN